MIPRLEFGHLYKFVVSVGLSLSAIAVALPFIVLREAGGLRIKQSEFDQLTPAGQRVIEQQQSHYAWLINNYTKVSGALGFIGFLVTGYGFVQWRKRQRILDKTEDVNLNAAQAQLENMSSVEVREKLDREVAEDIEAAPLIDPADAGAVDGTEVGPTSRAGAPTIGAGVEARDGTQVESSEEGGTGDGADSGSRAAPPDNLRVRPQVDVQGPTRPATSAEAFRAQYAEVERSVADEFTRSLANSYRVITHAKFVTTERVQHTSFVDLVLMPLSSGRAAWVVEVKYLSDTRNLRNRLVGGLTQVAEAAVAAESVMGGQVRGLVVYVVEGKPPTASEVSARIFALRRALKVSIDTLIIPRSDLEKGRLVWLDSWLVEKESGSAE